MVGDMCKRLVSSFEMHNCITLDKDAIEHVLCDKNINVKQLRMRLVSWMKIDYHPKVLFEDFVNTLEIFEFSVMKLDTYTQLVNLIHYAIGLREYLGLRRLDYIKNKNEFEEEQLLLRFYDFVEHFKRLVFN
jgi:hypothetical protein